MACCAFSNATGTDHAAPHTAANRGSVATRGTAQTGARISASALADRIKAGPAIWKAEAGKSSGDVCKDSQVTVTQTLEQGFASSFCIKAQRYVSPPRVVNSVNSLRGG